MPILCRLRPRHNATQQELKALATAFLELTKREHDHGGTLESFDPHQLADLTRGELPQPLALRIATSHEKLGDRLDLNRLREDLGSDASDRSLHFSVRETLSSDRQSIIRVLRLAIPAELVEDILIGDESWDQDD
jgi:hypothetical protein